MSKSSNNKEVVRKTIKNERLSTPLWLKEICDLTSKENSCKEDPLFIASLIDVFKGALEEVSLVVVIDQEEKIVYSSEGYNKMVQYKRNELIGKKYVELLDLNGISSCDLDSLTTAFNTNIVADLELSHSKKEIGKLIVLRTRVFPLFHLDQKIASLILHQDVTSIIKAQETIRELVSADVLTGLKNRNQFERDIEKMTSASGSEKENTALLFIDLDRFKYYNDTLGHFTGDKLIEEIANELILFENENLFVYRYGGDEFSIIINNFTEYEEIELITEQILNRFQSPFVVKENELFITATVGIALYPETGVAAALLVQQAEIAMQFAKERGKGGYKLYHPSLRTNHDKKLLIEQRLRLAAETKTFKIFYQPQIDLKENKVIGLEALLRWHDEKLGDVSPSEFIPIAEDSGLIYQIGDWVLEQACYQAKKWHDKGFAMRMGINISPKQFQRPDFVGKVKNILNKSGVDPTLLDLEITENDLLYNREECFKTLERLKELGMTISIDDFGTGYSSLSYLRQFPIDTLKIDQSFIREVIENANDQAIVTSIIQLAHNMNMRVIAEGVETAEMVMFLNERSCDEMQGFLYSKAMPAENVMSFVQDKEPNNFLQ
ncbi:EAL domain-containing protein [Salipaludibacillus sp. HK11]|uniref:sensor domain-containing protein n=1 Tax=Salipaludibacillus sp. HK11 TaxID=3394320 RepID=UPI0039FBBDAD